MIHVVAVLTAKPGKRDAVLKEFRANVPNVRAEKGCIEYGAAIDADPGPSFAPSTAPTASSSSRNGPTSTPSRPTPWRRTRRPSPRRSKT